MIRAKADIRPIGVIALGHPRSATLPAMLRLALLLTLLPAVALADVTGPAA